MKIKELFVSRQENPECIREHALATARKGFAHAAYDDEMCLAMALNTLSKSYDARANERDEYRARVGELSVEILNLRSEIACLRKRLEGAK